MLSFSHPSQVINDCSARKTRTKKTSANVRQVEEVWNPNNLDFEDMQVQSGGKIDRLFSAMKSGSTNWSDKKSIIMLAFEYIISDPGLENLIVSNIVFRILPSLE